MRASDAISWAWYCAKQPEPNARAVMERGVRYVDEHYGGDWPGCLSSLWERVYDRNATETA
jgi:hypothetical protein